MREIPLTRGYVALVDDEDFEWLSRWKWRVSGGSQTKHASRTERQSDGSRREVLMHRVILHAPDGTPVDHANRNGIDNRRCNLRLATASLNAANRESAPSKYGFRGVVYRSDRGVYRAQISFAGKQRRFGYFASPAEAARAYDREARHLFGAFAVLNFPDEAEAA